MVRDRAVLVALAAAIVMNELRIAGLLGAGAAARTAARGRAARGAPGLRPRQSRRLPRAQPALLLELIAARLVRAAAASGPRLHGARARLRARALRMTRDARASRSSRSQRALDAIPG